MVPLDVSLKLTTLRCVLHDERGSDEPYLWAVFFKVDGDTAYFDSGRMALSGTATVTVTDGKPRNLGINHMVAGQEVSILEAIGGFTTKLIPIPVRPPLGALTEVPPTLGYVSILMEEDNTPESVVSDAYHALGALEKHVRYAA